MFLDPGTWVNAPGILVCGVEAPVDFVGAGDAIYAGQIVGENPRTEDIIVNPTKEKHLTNHRSSGDGKGIQLSPPLKFSLERAIEYIAADELVEATPKNIRLRKRHLDPHERKRASRGVA